jgi:hypothetical protein
MTAKQQPWRKNPGPDAPLGKRQVGGRIMFSNVEEERLRRGGASGCEMLNSWRFNE